MLLSLTLASSVCVHRPSPLRFASRSRPALCLSPPATEAAVVNPALRSKVQPEIVELVSATESCQLMDPQQIDALVIVMHRYCTWIVGPWIPPPTHPGVQGGEARDRYGGPSRIAAGATGYVVYARTPGDRATSCRPGLADARTGSSGRLTGRGIEECARAAHRQATRR